MRAPDRLRKKTCAGESQGAAILPRAGVILGALHHQLGRLHTMALVEHESPPFRSALVDIARLAYLDGLADGVREDAQGLVAGRDRVARAAAYAIAVETAADTYLRSVVGVVAPLWESSDALWAELVSVFDRAGVSLDDGLTALGAPRLATLFDRPHDPAHRQETL